MPTLQTKRHARKNYPKLSNIIQVIKLLLFQRYASHGFNAKVSYNWYYAKKLFATLKAVAKAIRKILPLLILFMPTPHHPFSGVLFGHELLAPIHRTEKGASGNNHLNSLRKIKPTAQRSQGQALRVFEEKFIYYQLIFRGINF